MKIGYVVLDGSAFSRTLREAELQSPGATAVGAWSRIRILVLLRSRGDWG